MRKIKTLVPLLLILGFPLVACSQSVPFVPKVTLFGGYTIVRNQFNSGSTFNINGWDASITGKVAPWVGMVADFSSQYGVRSGEQEKQYMALFGPQFSPHVLHRVIPFAHVLVGVVHGTTGFTTGTTTGYSIPIITGNAFATAVGGGIDIKIFGPLWIRPIQADWIHATLGGDHHTQARIAAGIALHL